MTVDRLYNLIVNYFGYKAKDTYCDTEKQEVTCTLYDSFVFNCGFDDRYGQFGAGIKIGCNEYITSFIGKNISLNSDEKSIKDGIKIVDDYCRLRLPDKFLKAYDEAYN